MSEEKKSKIKRDLLPIWIKVFLWIFMLMAGVIPIVLLFSILGLPANLSLYGISSNTMFSLPGIIITILILYKGFIAFGLWTEKKWAVTHAIIDAIIGLCVCIIVILIPLFFSSNGFLFSFRIELIPLVLYLNKMKKIKNEWNDKLPDVELKNEEESKNNEPEPHVITYTKHTYTCEDGILTIEQEFQNPNIGEKVFLIDKPAPFGKYKLGFMSHIFVDNGIIESITSF